MLPNTFDGPDPFYNPLFPRQDCITCDTAPPACSCAAGQVCQRTTRTCSSCPTNICTTDPNSARKSGGTSPGALAGAVIGCILVLAIVVAAFFYFKRRRQAKSDLEEKNGQQQAQSRLSQFGQPKSILIHTQPPSPRSPHSPINPPTSPGGAHGEKSPVDIQLYTGSTINLDPNSAKGDPNPFSDNASVSTSGSGNVIPIAYVRPTSPHSGGPTSPNAQSFNAPARPVRSPDLNLRLPPNALSRLGLPDPNNLPMPKSPGNYPQSTRSGVSGVSSRASVLSSASSLLYESPTIVTSAKGRQVLGVVRAEVVQVSGTGPSTPTTPSTPSGGLRAQARARASQATVGRSPLGASSFKPEDMEREGMPSPVSPASPNPFSDSNAAGLSSPSNMSARTFGTSNSNMMPPSPRALPLPESRPGSSMDDAATNASTTPRAETFAAAHSLTSTHSGSGGDANSASNSTSSFPSHSAEEDHRTQEFTFPQTFGVPRDRVSQASFLTTGSRADSILASFPFVPPSPAGTVVSFQGQGGSTTPLASPGARSTTGFPSGPGHGYSASQSTVGAGDMESIRNFSSAPPVPQVPSNLGHNGAPGRRTMGLSTMSTASSGLDAFTFHFGSGVPMGSGAPASVGGAHPLAGPALVGPGMRKDGDRASLDTLTLSRDLEAYPLAFDR